MPKLSEDLQFGQLAADRITLRIHPHTLQVD